MSKTNELAISSILCELHQKISTKLIDLARRLKDHFYFVEFFNSNVLIKETDYKRLFDCTLLRVSSQDGKTQRKFKQANSGSFLSTKSNVQNSKAI